MRRLAVVSVLFCLVLAPLPLAAQSGSATVDAVPAASLDRLFQDLKAAPDPGIARVIESTIWKAWLKSGDAAVDALVDDAITAMGTRKLQEALAILDAVVSKAPAYAEGWNKRATVLYMAGDLERSLADIDHVLALEPRHFGALAGIGLIKSAKGDTLGAIAAYKRVLAIHPMSLGAKSSLEALEKALEGDPT